MKLFTIGNTSEGGQQITDGFDLEELVYFAADKVGEHKWRVILFFFNGLERTLSMSLDQYESFILGLKVLGLQVLR